MKLYSMYIIPDEVVTGRTLGMLGYASLSLSVSSTVPSSLSKLANPILWGTVPITIGTGGKSKTRPAPSGFPYNTNTNKTLKKVYTETLSNIMVPSFWEVL